jgi:hypothetical protein
VLSLSHPPTASKSALSLSREKAFTFKKSPHWMGREAGLRPGKARPSLPRAVLDQCILIAALLWRITKKGPSLARGLKLGGGRCTWLWEGEVEGRLGVGGNVERQSLNPVPNKFLWA